MKHILAYLLYFTFALSAAGQVDVRGTVLEKDGKEPLAGASVIIRDKEGKIKKYAVSKQDGAFEMSVPALAGARLEVSMMSFAKQSVALDSVSFPLTVYMEPGTTILKEVTVKSARIREQGDTVTYNVGSFAQNQDRSIGDVLKRMPGINVEKSGKIQYQGEDINKFYIEGSDMLGGKYGIATNGISHEDVGAVEVMENHQPMQVLSGISFSDKAAINLKLKNKAKAAWSFHGDAGGGYSAQPGGAIWDGELFAMAVMPSFQNISTVKTNNIGENISLQKYDFFGSRRGTELSPYVGVSLPGVPNLSRKRTLFNRSVLGSTNNLWKLGQGELKTQIDYSFDRVSADASSVTTYFLNDGNRVVSENRSGVSRTHSFSGKFVYELNKKTAFINNTLQTNLDWDKVRLGVAGSLVNDQSASLPNYYVCNNFKLIKRFKDNNLVTFQSVNEWESLPQTLVVATGANSMRQHIGDHAFFTHENAAYAFSIKGLTLSLEGGVKAYVRKLDAELSDMPAEVPGLTRSVVNTDYLTVYAVPKFEYWVKKVNVTLNVPVSFAHYAFDQSIANRSEFYFSPSLSLNWKPSNKVSVGLRGGTGRSPMNLNLIHPAFIMTDYRSFCSGVDNFYNTTSQNVSASISYKHTRNGLFANAFVMHGWTHLPYTMAQQLYGDYIVYSYSDAKNDGDSFMASGRIGKTLDFMRGSLNVNGSFSRNGSHLISESRSVKSVATSWSAGIRISGEIWRWLSFDYKFNHSSSRMSMNGDKASWLGSMENELLLNVRPYGKWEWEILGEHYRNQLASDRQSARPGAASNYKNVLLFDTKIVYKLNKRIELSASLNNILNSKSYNYTTYNQLNSFESQRKLRGREFLISLLIKK